MKIKAIITDIEGTTSSIDFVHHVLFPYSIKALPEYVRRNSQRQEIATIITQVKQEINQLDANIEVVIATLLSWIEADKKITPLKTLQGFIWENGFKNSHFTGHLYEDAYHNLLKWYRVGIKLYVFSSGSIKAQKLLFGYNHYGDLTYLFEGYFDTNIGSKKSVSAYQNIAKAIGLMPQEILFLSDVTAELDSAKNTGYHTVLLDRNESQKNNQIYDTVTTFDFVNLRINANVV